ncbi:ferrous iron transporter A (plasmid) [Borreliella turdi]|uniref:ferrous iron transporter A n=1 Tax=Borreliella turdi TaxID=57863 RepID=UPI00264969F5|nr:ferrous iron transporter A [Borreliella turdi]WKC78436.1 ferrous iron transporter A [Borreliella turdi]
MKVQSKYLALGLLFGFISCDLFMRDKMKEESLDLFNEGSSILDASGKKSVKKYINKQDKNKVNRKKGKDKVARKTPPTHSIKMEPTNNSNLLQKNIISEKENLKTELLREQPEPKKEKIQKQQGVHKGVTQGSLSSLKGESSELREETIQSNEINFTISSYQTVSGSNSTSSIYEIEEEDYDKYSYLEEDDKYDEEIRLSNQYESYLEGVKYNVDLAIKTIVKIYNNYTVLSIKQAQMYSTRLNYLTKDNAKEEAKKFTKVKLEKDLNALLTYIQMSAKTATNFVYASEVYAGKILNGIETGIKNLISKVKEKSNSYEAYKAIISSILSIKDSLKRVQSVIDNNGVWY